MLEMGQRLQDKKTETPAIINHVFSNGEKLIYDVMGIFLTEKGLLSMFRVISA